jgi:radical SAM superfamily enzyme YgiQ (UPF0313 family)
MNKGHCIFLTCCQSDDTVLSPLRALGAYLCAHYLEENGYECDVIDYIEFLSAEQLANIINYLVRPDTIFVGISNTFLKTGKFSGKLLYEEKEVTLQDRTHTYSDDLVNALFLIKSKHPKLKIVVGGAKASYLGHHLFDCAIHGFGENLILEYADWLIGKNPFLKYSMDPKWTNMMVIKESNNPKFNIQKSNFHFQDKHCILPGEALPLEIGRGCIFKCKFCGFPGTGKKKGEFIRSAECITNELSYNYEHFGTTRYWFSDETFNDDTDKLRMLADLVSKLPFKIEFTAYIRIDLLRAHREQLELLEEIGLKSCFFGIETFNKEAGKIIGKGLTGEPCKEFILELKERWEPKEITFHNNFIVGLPEDSLEEQYATHEWHIKNKMRNWQFQPLMVLSSVIHGGKMWLSEFEKNVDKYGFRFPKADPFYWENDYTNWIEVTKIANDIRMKYTPITYSAAWSWVSLCNMGYTSLSEQNKFSRADFFNNPILKKKKNELVETYLNILCSYHNIIL